MAIPNKQMQENARRGLRLRREYGRGGTSVGVARARDIMNGRDLSDRTVRRMFSYFSRHESNYAEHYGENEPDGGPNAFTIAWLLWGGDSGYKWSKRLVEQMNNEKGIDMNAATDEQIQHRSFELGRNVLDEDNRTIEMSISSEKPYERGYGTEILDHTRESMDLEFLNSGNAPLLLDHDMEKQIGVIERVYLDQNQKKLRAVVRLGRGQLASEVFNDIVDGIRKNVSIGYIVNKMKKEEGGVYRAIDYKIFEASIVSIPADEDVGVNRAFDNVTVNEGHQQDAVTSVEFDSSDLITHEETPNQMTNEDKTMSDVDIKAIEAEAHKTAYKDAAKIIELGSRHNQIELAQKAIAEGRSISDFRGELLDTVGSKEAAQPAANIGMSEKEVKRFSIVKAVRALANPHDRKAQEEAAFEFECSQATGRNTQGIIVPADVLNSYKRDLNSTDEATLFTDDFRGGDFVDVLRNQSSVMAAGATVLSGLSGDVKIPKKATAASAVWVDEGSAVDESEMTTTSISMSPKTVGAFTDVTSQLLTQSSLDIENLIREDLAQAIAIAMDKAALEGTGASSQPTGVLNTQGVNLVSQFSNAVPSFGEVVSLETAVAEDNALLGNLAYILPASMYGALKTKEKATNTAQFIVEPGGTINGYRAIVSNQATAGNLYFGNFADVLVGMFGGLELVVDPYSNAPSGLIRITARQMMDVAVRYAQSFAYGNDTAQ